MKSSRTLSIAADHPAFAGHFPGTPILPGAVLLDEALHIVELERGLDLTQWQVVVAKFLALVRPGESLTIEHSSAASGTVHFTVRIDGRAALAGTLSMISAAHDS